MENNIRYFLVGLFYGVVLYLLNLKIAYGQYNPGIIQLLYMMKGSIIGNLITFLLLVLILPLIMVSISNIEGDRNRIIIVIVVSVIFLILSVSFGLIIGPDITY